MNPPRKLLLGLIAAIGVAIVSVAFGAEAVAGIGEVTLETRIDLGTVLTLLVMGGGVLSVWVKINRESARQQAQIEALQEGQAQIESRQEARQARTDASIAAVHKRMDAFLFSVQPGRPHGQ